MGQLAKISVLFLLFQKGRCQNPCSVYKCNSSGCDYDNCIACADGYYRHSNGSCYLCHANCATCSAFSSCSSCKDNTYTHKGFCFLCPSGCTRCSRNDFCSACEMDHFMHNNLCYPCPSRCSKCTSYTACTECKLNSFWGTTCQHKCTGCTSKTCSKESGCSSGCDEKYYLYDSPSKNGYECLMCQTHCKSCTGWYECQSCDNGFRGDFCQIHGCIDGYYEVATNGGKQCYECPINCKQCTESNQCTACKRGFNGTTCQHNCQSCNAQLCSGDTGSCLIQCTTDQFFDEYNSKCTKCPNGCTSCDSTNCRTCVSGRWGQACENTCNNCRDKQCRQSNGHCTDGCTDGYYDDMCTSSCLSVCETCSSRTDCDTCKAKYFHQDDSKKLCDCRQDYCSFYTGEICQSCSHDGWYPKNKGCCPCSTNCLDMSCHSDGTCRKCKYGTFGASCDQVCPSNCLNNECHRHNGTCVSCIANKYGPECIWQCSAHIGNCTKCYGQVFTSPICTQCYEHSNTYANGKQCSYCSSHCKRKSSNQTCNSTNGTCLNGCEVGWFGDKCDTKCNVSNCKSCSENDLNVCTECFNGFYLKSNHSCNICPSNCRTESSCNSFSGVCDEGCIDKFSGLYCDVKCPVGCIQCDQFGNSSCSICETGLYGDSCKNACNIGCASRNLSTKCSITNGSCAFDCKEGFWDDRCDKQCGDGCSEHVCNRITGYCLSSCESSYYGPRCDKPCSINCGNSSRRKCDIANGSCLEICNNGWFGDQCNEHCSKTCKDNICYLNNGSCSAGCIDGYTGSKCMQVLQPGTPVNMTAIFGGVGAGVVIIITIVVVVGLRKRRTSIKTGTRDGGVCQERQLSSDNRDTFNTIDETGAHPENVNISEVSNRLLGNASKRMPDLSETDDPAIPLVASKTNSRQSSVDYFKEVELEEGEVHDYDTDQSGEVDHTYYNVGGKRVKVTQMAEYIKHKSKRDLFKDFGKLPVGLLKSHNEARKASNAAKNRYKAIYPYDENRVVLLDGGADYMNASYVDGYNRSKEYIASSGPFKRSYETTPDFWLMIWQEKCETIVMLTKHIENSQPKCEKYWPEPGESCTFGDLNISCLTEDPYADFDIRILTVTKGDVSFNIHHVHFTAWPDKSIPHDVTSMIEFRQKVRSIHKGKSTPMLVHCSAGIGRTGTFIALDMLIYEGEDRGSIDIFGVVASLRFQRCHMVQTPEQYAYLHHAVLHALTFDCRSIPGDTFLQNYNKLIERSGGERKIDLQFQQLQLISKEMADTERAEIAIHKALLDKNRNDADIPADGNRVKLHENRKLSGSDYINAVYINSSRKHRKFIAAMSPLPSTVVDFLSLVWQEKCSYIVSLDDPNTEDKTIKVYWPADNQVVKLDKFKVKCKTSKKATHYVCKKLSVSYHGPTTPKPGGYAEIGWINHVYQNLAAPFCSTICVPSDLKKSSCQTFLRTKGDETRDVSLFIFSNWPASSLVPNSSDSLVDLIRTVDKLNQTSASEHPILIHCRTGAERSCLYCAVSVLISKMETEHEVSVVNTLRQIKARRLKAISSIEEYEFCHQAVISYLKSLDNY